MTVRNPQGSVNKSGGASQPPRSTTSGSRPGTGNRRGGGASQPPRSTTGGSHQRPGNRRGGGYWLPVTIAVGAMIAVVGVVYTANEDVRYRVDDFTGRRSGAPASPTETPIDIERKVQAAVATAQAPSSPAPDVRATTEAAIASTVEALLPTPTGEVAPLAVASTSTPAPTLTAPPAPTHTSSPTATPVPATATPTPTPTSTATPTVTPSPTPTPAATPTATPTNTPTPTPEPRVVLVLKGDATIDGYWSDGTADVTVSATLRNDGDLRVDAAQTITATCTPAADGCNQELILDLPDGHRPATAKFTVRAPMGITTVIFHYGASEPMTLDIDVPERILGVDRDLWECYADRPTEGFALGAHNDWTAGCGGWGKPTVEKWLNDVPVKVWATGHPDYIAVLENILLELSPILNLEFVWVDAEEEADFRAFVGVSRSEADSLGVRDPFYVDEAWGFASANVNRGEATSGYMVVWDTDLTDLTSRVDAIRGVTIHEALHALGPIYHRVPLGHSSRPLSVMEVAKPGAFIPRERQLLALNSHPLVRPEMSMDDVRELIVLTEELLDYSLIASEAAPDDPLDLIRRAYVELERAESAGFRLSGGWTGDRTCNRQPFGVRRGPVVMSIGEFSLTGDWPVLDPELVHLDFGTSRFLIRRDDGEWLHWWLSPEGAWEMVYREAVNTPSSYWLWNGKLLATLRSVLWDGSPEDISVEETADGNLRLQDHSGPLVRAHVGVGTY